MGQVPSRRFRWSGFADAGRGIWFVLRTQPNARVHLVATFAAVTLGFWLGLSAAEWTAIAGTIGLVWVSEALNTAVELVVDLVSPQRQEVAGRAKDVAAGAVLLAALSAAAVGLLIFGPKLWLRFF